MNNFPSPAGQLADLQREFAAFYPDQPLVGEVSAIVQSKQLDNFYQRIPHEHFYFVIEMPDFKIKSIGGVYTWLGYLESEFSMETYIAALHPGLIDHQIDHAKISTAKYARGEKDLVFNTPLFSVIQAIKQERSGKYLLVKRLVLPFQFTDNRLTAYLSYFTILGEYKNENLQFQYPDGQSDIALGIAREIKNKFWERLQPNLSPSAIRLLETYINYPNLTAQEVLLQWGTKASKRTIQNYCRDILAYGKDQYPDMEFKTAKDVAQFISKEFEL